MQTLPIAYSDLVIAIVILSMHVEVGEIISKVDIGASVLILLRI
jgi:hypothetical protein